MVVEVEGVDLASVVSGTAVSAALEKLAELFLALRADRLARRTAFRLRGASADAPTAGTFRNTIPGGFTRRRESTGESGARR